MMNKLLIILIILSSLQSVAQVDPSIDWKVIDDTHARWLYDSRHKDLILQYRKNFAKAFPRLKSIFGEVPDKTTFVISDHTDMPNGSATVFPYPLINLFPVIPIPTSGIGETNDSFFEILVHEYTHILNLYPVHGGMKVLKTIFGNIIYPNMLLPRWYVEGLAVYSESYFNPKGGRLRSQNFEGMARAISLDNSWHRYSIDKLNDSKPDWVGGQRPYLLGGALMHNIFTSNGNKQVRGLNQRYSRRLPYSINGPLKDFSGKNYHQNLIDTYSKILVQARKQQQIIQTEPTLKGQQLPKQGYNSYRPRISADHLHLSFISQQHNTRSALYLVRRTKENNFIAPPIELVRGDGITNSSWSSDSQFLAYNKIENYKRYYKYSDLFIYDLKKQTHKQITHGARAGAMSYSPDSKKIFFVQNKTGFKQIVEFNFETKKTTTIYKPTKLGAHIYGLIAKNEKLFFIEKTNIGQILKSLNLSSKRSSAIPLNTTHISSLRITPQGLLLTSSQSGAGNLYLIKNFLDTTSLVTEPVTNSLTHVVDGDLDPLTGDLYYAEMTPLGGKIHFANATSISKITKVPPIPTLLSVPEISAEKVSEPTLEPKSPQSNRYVFKRNVAQVNSTSTQTEPETTIDEGSFYPFRYLIPRYWLPFPYLLDGGIGFNSSTSASDPLLKNTYSLGLTWDTLTEKLGGSFLFSNRSTPLTISLGAHDLFRYNRANESVLEDSGGRVGFRSFIPYLSNNWNWGANYKYSKTQLSSGDIVRSGPGAHITYNNTTKKGLEISPESGGSLSLIHQSYLKNTGDVSYGKTNINVKSYFSKWLPKRHVLYGQINGTFAPDLKYLRVFNNKLPTSFYTDTIGGNFVSNSLVQPFLVRGYTSGDIIGYNMASVNLEYRFPLLYTYRGVGKTFPLFLKRVHGSFLVDGVTVDGFRRSQKTNSFKPTAFGEEWYVGTGAELHLDCTIGYYIPITFTFGVYYGTDSDISENDINTFFSFRL